MTKIEWAGETWNSVVGCRAVSSGCDNCYAKKIAHRFSGDSGHPHYRGTTEVRDGRVDWTGDFNLAPEHIITKPLRNKKATLYFGNSMSDIFGEGVPDDHIFRVWEIMAATPHHTYQMLTKRPNRLLKMASRLPWPENVWMGTSIESDKYVNRADLLRKVPAAIRFLSCEPLLGPLPSLKLDGIDWVIVGGESGPGSRPMSIDWARDLRDRCNAAGVAYFFKQWGNWDAEGRRHHGKKDAGRLLDGRMWEEMPGDVVAKPVPVEPVTIEVVPHTWGSIGAFRDALADEHRNEEERPTLDGTSPRIALRRVIWDDLRASGPSEAPVLRERVLASVAIDADRARWVNLHAWALVDLQAGGYVESYKALVPGKRGRVRTAKLYRAIKPRVRVRQEAA